MSRHTPLAVLSVHGMLGESLEQQLSSVEHFDVTRHTSVEACRRDMASGRIGVLLADVSYASDGLLELLTEAAQRSIRLVLLGLDPDRGRGQQYLELEADASLPLDITFADLVAAIDQVLAGGKIYPPSIAYMLYRRLAQKAEERELRRRLTALTLTRREVEILHLVAEQCSNETIASRLGISIHTVKNHVHNILDKLQVDNRASAAELAVAHGWIETDHSMTRLVSIAEPRGVST